MKTILCYGDSNTYGLDPSEDDKRYTEKERWTGVLSTLLGENYHVIEEGLNGRTTAFDRPDGKWKNGYPYLTPCLLSHVPIDTVIFMLGTNDCNSDLYLSVDTISKGMEKVLKKTLRLLKTKQKNEPRILLITPAAMKEGAETKKYAQTTDSTSIVKSKMLREKYYDISKRYNCLYLDGTDKYEVSDIDCVHLTKKGHRDLASDIYNILKDNNI